MVGRKERFKMIRVRESIYGPLEQRMRDEGFVGGFSPFGESLCQKYIKGLLVDRKVVEAEIREQLYAELAAEGLYVAPEKRNERNRKTG